MFLPFPFRRVHSAEIDDQPWFHPTLRAHVQTILTKFWTVRLPPFQALPPASLAAQKLQSVLRNDILDYTFVDFCSGAGGPTPYIEHDVNAALRAAAAQRKGQLNGHAKAVDHDGGADEVAFIMTDIHPHKQGWREACAASESGRLMYLPAPLDASRATKQDLALATGNTADSGSIKIEERKIFRTFSLAFHHFDDDLAIKILRNTFATSDGFAIFELQARDVGNCVTVLLMGPIMILHSWYWFWGNWSLLFWMYILPIVPFVVVYDGLISCLRTRTEQEVFDLIKEAAGDSGEGIDGWRFEVGEEIHSWPIGTMNYFIGIKNGS